MISPFRGANHTPVFGLLVTSVGISLHACILRCTSGETPADCVEVSMAVVPFQSMSLQRCPHVLVEVMVMEFLFQVNTVIIQRKTVSRHNLYKLNPHES